MKISKQFLNEVANRLQIISASGRSSLEQVMITAPKVENVDEMVSYLISNCKPIIVACMDNAAALGTNTYNVYRKMQTGEVIENVEYLPNNNYSGMLVNVAKTASATGDVDFISSTMTAVLDSAVKHSYEGAMLEASYSDPLDVRFARVPRGANTCDFCMMLASRGFVYRTRETAGEWGGYHAFCDCQIVPQFDTKGNAVNIPGYSPDELYKQYKNGDFGFTSDGKGIKRPIKKNFTSAKMPDIEKPINVEHVDAELPNKAYSGEWNQQEDMKKFLGNVFEKDDYVGTCSKFFESNGRMVPTKGLYQRTCGQINNVLNRTNNVAAAVGRYDKNLGAYVRINPLDGKGITDLNVKSFKYALIEADVGSMESQYGWIKALNLPTKAVVTSGNKSVHALVKVDASNIAEYKERVARLQAECKAAGYNVDAATKNPSRYMRIPGIKRGDGRQVLISIDEGASSWDEWLKWADNNR